MNSKSLYRAAAAIAALAVLIAAFSAIFIHDGKIGLPGGDKGEEALASVDGGAPKGASGDGDGGKTAQPIASARTRQTPDAAPSPMPSVSTPAELGETLPAVFERLLELTQCESVEDYAQYGIILDEEAAQRLEEDGNPRRFYRGGQDFGEYQWHFDINSPNVPGEFHLGSFIAEYSSVNYDAESLAKAYIDGFAMMFERYGEPTSLRYYLTENPASIPTYDDVLKELQASGKDNDARVSALWLLESKEVLSIAVSILNASSDGVPTIGFLIDRATVEQDAPSPAASATPAAPDTPAPTAKPTPAPSNSLAGTSWRTKIGSERGFDIYTELQFFKDGTYYEIMYTYYESDGGYSFESTIVGTYSVSGNRLSLSGEGRSADGGILGSPAPYSAEYFISRTDDGRGMMLSYDEGYRGVEYTAAKPRFDWREHLARALQ